MMAAPMMLSELERHIKLLPSVAIEARVGQWRNRGPWYEIRPGVVDGTAQEAIVIVRLDLIDSSARHDGDVEFEFAVGWVAAEVVVYRLRWRQRATDRIDLFLPLEIGVGQRLSVRAQSSHHVSVAFLAGYVSLDEMAQARSVIALAEAE